MAAVPGPTPKSPASTTYSTTDQSATDNPNNESPSNSKSPGYGEPGFLRGFPPTMQKKVTRDGQPAKRRGPKPDSKPAQTRRQELNRQAQRTHRERKEQYIKALEAEVARLRDAYIIERKQVQQALEQQQMLLQDRHLENYALKEMFKARGITYDAELQNRKQQLMMSQSQNQTTNAGPMLQQHRNFSQLVQQPPSITFQPLTDPGFSNGGSSVMSGHSPNARQSHSPPAAQVLEYGQKPDKQIADMPGIFERDPQLGIDFILALEETCRDHGEYLVRRSMNSPNNAEQALFSGHALMASCPPPSHITSTPALSEGLQPTYPHQAPAVPMETLNTLLNLSQVIKSEGFFEGGQVTPIQALQSLRGHQGYRSLTRDDVIGMIDSIRNKVRCYGFGAVMEDFELRDALSSIFATKPEMYDHMHTDVTSQVEDMYS